jgi:hypothetical protein
LAQLFLWTLLGGLSGSFPDGDCCLVWIDLLALWCSDWLLPTMVLAHSSGDVNPCWAFSVHFFGRLYFSSMATVTVFCSYWFMTRCFTAEAGHGYMIFNEYKTVQVPLAAAMCVSCFVWFSGEMAVYLATILALICH